jgi:hypothetical protein
LQLTFSKTPPLFLALRKDAAEAATDDSFLAAGAAIPSRAKNNGATTTISFHSFN